MPTIEETQKKHSQLADHSTFACRKRETVCMLHGRGAMFFFFFHMHTYDDTHGRKKSDL